MEYGQDKRIEDICKDLRSLKNGEGVERDRVLLEAKETIEKLQELATQSVDNGMYDIFEKYSVSIHSLMDAISFVERNPILGNPDKEKQLNILTREERMDSVKSTDGTHHESSTTAVEERSEGLPLAIFDPIWDKEEATEKREEGNEECASIGKKTMADDFISREEMTAKLASVNSVVAQLRPFESLYKASREVIEELKHRLILSERELETRANEVTSSLDRERQLLRRISELESMLTKLKWAANPRETAAAIYRNRNPFSQRPSSRTTDGHDTRSSVLDESFAYQPTRDGRRSITEERCREFNEDKCEISVRDSASMTSLGASPFNVIGQTSFLGKNPVLYDHSINNGIALVQSPSRPHMNSSFSQTSSLISRTYTGGRPGDFLPLKGLQATSLQQWRSTKLYENPSPPLNNQNIIENFRSCLLGRGSTLFEDSFLLVTYELSNTRYTESLQHTHYMGSLVDINRTAITDGRLIHSERTQEGKDDAIHFSIRIKNKTKSILENIQVLVEPRASQLGSPFALQTNEGARSLKMGGTLKIAGFFEIIEVFVTPPQIQIRYVKPEGMNCVAPIFLPFVPLSLLSPVSGDQWVESDVQEMIEKWNTTATCCMKRIQLRDEYRIAGSLAKIECDLSLGGRMSSITGFDMTNSRLLGGNAGAVVRLERDNYFTGDILCTVNTPSSVLSDSILGTIAIIIGRY